MRPQRALVLILMAALCSFPCWAEDGASEASDEPMPATSDIRDEEGTSEDFNEEEKALREALKDAAKEAKASLHEAAKAAHAHLNGDRSHECHKQTETGFCVFISTPSASFRVRRTGNGIQDPG